MKRVLLMVFSIILILACIFGLFACVAGVRDVLNIQEYKTADAAFARENLKTAEAGIAQLRENEQTYLTGVGAYTDGLSQYTKGKSEDASALCARLSAPTQKARRIPSGSFSLRKRSCAMTTRSLPRQKRA